MQEEKYVLHGPKLPTTGISNISLGLLLRDRLKLYGPRVAQIDAFTEEERTFDQILNISEKLAIYLNQQGLKPNDRIAISSENNLQFCLPVCAAMFLGCAICPLNPLYSEGELRHSLNISKPKIIFVSPISLNVVQQVANQLPWSPKIIVLKTIVGVELPSIETVISKIHSNESSYLKSHVTEANDHVAAILCSSGTTGLPKGVMLTVGNIRTILEQHLHISFGFNRQNNVNLAILPYFHAYSFNILLIAVITGTKAIVLPRFDENIFLRSIEKYRIEHVHVVPPLVLFLAKHPMVDKFDLSSVKVIWSGGAALSESLQNAVIKRFKILDIRQGYGLTETTLGVLRTPDSRNKQGSLGVLYPGISGKVIRAEDGIESNESLGPNCPGELCFKGGSIMKGYCNDEASTSAILDKDGWLRTGDIGYYDEDGFFYIIDRRKELIKYKGFQVPPAELEAILSTCPGVKDAAVVGKSDEEAGELPVAFIVKQDNSDVSVEQIMKYVNDRVSNQKRLRGGIRFVKEIPKSPSGKILRRILRDTLQSKL